MAMQYDKNKILEEIKAQMKACRLYQSKDPDKAAMKRVENASKIPYKVKKYYVNLTLSSDPKNIVKTDAIEERTKHLKSKRFLANFDDIKTFFEEGCIIETSVKGTELKHTVTSVTDFGVLIDKLLTYWFDKSCLVKALEPSPLTMVDDDINVAKSSGKSKIVYSIARFSLTGLSSLLEKSFDTEKYSIYETSIDNMVPASYVNMLRKTSLEQNVNQLFMNPGVMNNVTMFSAKSNLPNFALVKSYAVYDMCIFMNGCLADIEKNDKAIAKEKFDFFTTKDNKPP